MQRLEVSGEVRPIYGSLGVKRLMCLLLSPTMQSNAGMAKQTEERRLALHANLRSHLALWLVG